MIDPKISLVGAGPGDPELITLKGINCLKEADVVLYDALIHTDLLNYAPESALKIYVGKRVGVCQMSQEKINETLVACALTYGHVVRLKGGDPFVFGRGHEELENAKNQNIPVSIIPGISSSISVPELQHIPITRRGMSESFWVITGTTKNHELSADVKVASQSNATVVILMGTKKLSQICKVFRGVGKSNTPIAIIQNGSYDNEKSVLGTIDDIEIKALEHNISSPAIIVIGEVVTLHPNYLGQFQSSLVTKE